MGHTKAGYSLHTFKIPSVGNKAGKLVAMLTNFEVARQHTTHTPGYELPTVVQVYRNVSNSFHRCN